HGPQPGDPDQRGGGGLALGRAPRAGGAHRLSAWPMSPAHHTESRPMSRTTLAVVVEAPGRLGLATVPLAAALADEVTIEVHALSLNRGEVKRALTMSDAGARPGWDIAGIVIEAA